MNRKLQVLAGKLRKKGKQLTQKDKKKLLALPAAEMQQVVAVLPTAVQQGILSLLERPIKHPIAPPWLDQTKEVQGKYPILVGCSEFKEEVKRTPTQHIVESIMIAAGDCISPDPAAVELLEAHVQQTFRRLIVLTPSDLKSRFPSALKRFQALRKKISVKTESESEDETWLLNDSDSEDSPQSEQDRLEFNDLRTAAMSASEYQIFTNSRRANFLSIGRKQFLAWVDKGHLSSAAAADLLAYVVWDYTFRVVEEAVRSCNQGNLAPLKSRLSVQSIEEACKRLN